MLGRESWHAASLCHGQTTPLLDPHPVRPAPRPAIATITRILEDLLQCAVLRRRCQKQPHRLIRRLTRPLGRFTRTGHVQRHGMGDILVPLAPDLYGIINLHALSLAPRAFADNAENPRLSPPFMSSPASPDKRL